MYQESVHHTVYHSLNRAYGTQVTDTSYYTNTTTVSTLCQCPTCTNQIHVLAYETPAPVLLPPVEHKPQYDWRGLLPYPRCNIVRGEGRGRHPPLLVRATLSPRSSARRKSWRTIRRAKPTPSEKDYVNHGDARPEPQYE